MSIQSLQVLSSVAAVSGTRIVKPANGSFSTKGAAAVMSAKTVSLRQHGRDAMVKVILDMIREAERRELNDYA